jgi:hypothetical protein
VLVPCWKKKKNTYKNENKKLSRIEGSVYEAKIYTALLLQTKNKLRISTGIKFSNYYNSEDSIALRTQLQRRALDGDNIQ